jgi:hypothetical protein
VARCGQRARRHWPDDLARWLGQFGDRALPDVQAAIRDIAPGARLRACRLGALAERCEDAAGHGFAMVTFNGTFMRGLHEIIAVKSSP